MIKEQGIAKGAIVDNRDFGDFPFEKLLQLDDNSFAKPNQYQSIWKNLILNIFAKAIANFPIEDDNSNSYFNEIERYANVCLGNLVEMHKELVARTTKTSGGLSLDPISASYETEHTLSIGYGSNNISTINSSLENYIVNYFVTCSSNKKIYIQFDRLDDSYNQYLDTEQYYQAIISLFKTVYYS